MVDRAREMTHRFRGAAGRVRIDSLSLRGRRRSRRWHGDRSGQRSERSAPGRTRAHAVSVVERRLSDARAELADLVNVWIREHVDRQVDIDANYIGKLERGQIRWPQETYWTALRETLGVARDADLGFRRPRRATRRSDTSAVDRKEFLQVALGAGAALIAAHPLTELAQTFVAPEVPSSVGRPEIDDLLAAFSAPRPGVTAMPDKITKENRLCLRVGD